MFEQRLYKCIKKFELCNDFHRDVVLYIPSHWTILLLQETSCVFIMRFYWYCHSERAWAILSKCTKKFEFTTVSSEMRHLSGISVDKTHTPKNTVHFDNAILLAPPIRDINSPRNPIRKQQAKTILSKCTKNSTLPPTSIETGQNPPFQWPYHYLRKTLCIFITL